MPLALVSAAACIGAGAGTCWYSHAGSSLVSMQAVWIPK